MWATDVPTVGVGDSVRITLYSEGSRGFSDKEFTYAGTVTEVDADRCEFVFECNGTHDGNPDHSYEFAYRTRVSVTRCWTDDVGRDREFSMGGWTVRGFVHNGTEVYP